MHTCNIQYFIRYNFCAIYIKHMQFVLYTLYKFIGCMGDCHTAFEFGKNCTHYTCWPAILKGEKTTSVSRMAELNSISV